MGVPLEAAEESYLPATRVAQRYNVCRKTLHRWNDDASLDFPKALDIRGRLFYRVRDLETWERARASK
jgi:hypothetical protein